MTAIVSHSVPHSTRTVAPGRRLTPLLLVVGYDGSASSRRALDAAANMIHRRPGHLSVVFVATLGGAASMSAETTLGRRLAMDTLAVDLAAEVRAALADREPRWDFRRRDGVVAGGLMATADELRQIHGPMASVVVVVGSSGRHHLFGSVPVSLAREGHYPTLVYPATDQVVSRRRRRTAPSDTRQPVPDRDADA